MVLWYLLINPTIATFSCQWIYNGVTSLQHGKGIVCPVFSKFLLLENNHPFFDEKSFSALNITHNFLKITPKKVIIKIDHQKHDLSIKVCQNIASVLLEVSTAVFETKIKQLRHILSICSEWKVYHTRNQTRQFHQKCRCLIKKKKIIRVWFS